MRDRGNIPPPQCTSSKPSVSLTADYISYKNGERQAYMNEYCRKDTLKKAVQKSEGTGLFGPVSTERCKADLQINCALTMEQTHKWSDFWMSFVTLQLYADRYNYKYTLRTKVTDTRTGESNNFASSDIITVYSSIWLIPVAPFMPAITEAKNMEQYLFDSTVTQMSDKGVFKTVSAP